MPRRIPLRAVAALWVVAMPWSEALSGEGSLDLSALLAEVEASAPSLKAAASRVAEAETLPSQAAALPDPVISTSFQNESLDSWTLGDTPMSNITFSWSQEIPYPGKRARRTEAARAEAGVAAAATDRVRLDLRARVKSAFVDLHRIHRVRGLVEENRRLLEAIRDTARAKFETGGAPLEGTLGAGAEIARLDAEIAALDGERAEAEARLASLLGRRGDPTFGTADQPPVEVPFDARALADGAEEGSAQVAILRATASRDEARIEALRLEEKPDFSWSAGYAYRRDLDPMVMGMFGVRLPLFRDAKQRRAVAQAERALDAVRHETDQALIEASASVREGLARAATAAARVRVLENAVVPQARAALDAATAAYASGRVDFGTILEYARALLADARVVENLRAERLTALALLEPAVGRDLVVPAGVSP